MLLRGGIGLKKINGLRHKPVASIKITGENFKKQMPQLNSPDDFYLLYASQGFIQFNSIISQKMQDILQLVCSNLAHQSNPYRRPAEEK